MPNKFSLDGAMIPRTVKRVFDQRDEERGDPATPTAVLNVRGRDHVVPLLNQSSSGAMAIYPGVLHIGEEVGLQLPELGSILAHVRWVRDGRIGIHFAEPLG